MKTLARISLCLIAFIALTASAAKKPNIVFFFADDLGYADLGCYGHPYAKTPTLDQLAAEGTRFTQHYVTGVTCNPSRTGLMTGLFPARFPKYAAGFGFGERTSITELLKNNGYRTGHFGKWHIGPKSSEKDGTYGMDTVKVIGNSRAKNAGRDDDLTGAAIDFIKENSDGPFYVNIWGHSTHFPVNTAEPLVEKFKDVKVNRDHFSSTMQNKFDECLEIGGKLDESMRQYLGDVYSIDLNMARVLKAIDDLGIRDNTIVVFSSDHGPAPVKLASGTREFSNNMLGYAGQYRGGKHNQYEGGVRVPFIIRWPGHVPAGRVESKSVTSFIDWMPTLGALTGIKNLPTKLDGEDISDIWLGDSRERTKNLYWKVSAKNGAPAMREGNWKIQLGRKNALELYDLSTDPSESTNVAKEFPKIAAKLKAKLQAWNNGLPADYIKTEKKNKPRTKKK